MLPIKSWRIIYADGSVFSSYDGTWAEAPPFGVQAVVYYHAPSGVTVQEVGADVSIYEHIALPEGTDKSAKMGLWTDGESYWRIHNAVKLETTP